MIPISLRPVISKTARDRDSVLTGHRLPQPYIKAVTKFTWWIYALSERLVVSGSFQKLIMLETNKFAIIMPVKVQPIEKNSRYAQNEHSWKFL